MKQESFALWVYLSRTPLLWLTVTLVAYLAADRISAATNRHPLANPVLHAIWFIGAVLVATATPYATYFEGAQFVHFLLGPAIVALAIPLYEHRATVARAAVPMLAALLAGSIVAIDRKSTRLNSSHEWISYAVFCLKKKKKNKATKLQLQKNR